MSSLLHLACAIVDLIDVQLSTVVICIEDGWDATCQLAALSELLLDPYYRHALTIYVGYIFYGEVSWILVPFMF